MKTYIAVFVTLLALLAATVMVSYVPLGKFHIVVPLAIALGKTFLVMLFFMHVRHSGRLVWIYAGVGFFWVGLLITGVLADSLTRWWLSP